MDIRLMLGIKEPLAEPSPSWQRYHSRTAATHAVIERLNHWQGGDLNVTDIPSVTDVFRDLSDLLQALQNHWHAVLAGHIDSALEDGEDLRTDVVKAYHQSVAELPGVRRVLDQYAEHPAIRRAVRSERRQIAVAAGVATYDSPMDTAVALGSGLIRQDTPYPAARAVSRPSFIARLRGAEA